jgi:TorA maturation chaperone TorD
LSFGLSQQAEELQRAELYGVLSRLWMSAPDEGLMQDFKVAVTQAPQAGAFLEEPWQRVVAAFRETPLPAAQEEFNALFQGVGKPEILAYGSFYMAGFLNEKPLAALRADLATLGLGRDESLGETEDHVAYLFEVMRYLIAGDDIAVCHLEQQRRFFRTHVQPWVGAMCAAVQEHPSAKVWREVAALTDAFMAVETQAFDLLET